MKILSNLTYCLPGSGIEIPVDVELLHYDNGRIALQLVTQGRGFKEDVTRCTVNLVDEDCPVDEVWVKDYAENTGMTEWLIGNEVIDPAPTDNTQTGFSQVSRYRLSSKFLEAIADVLIAEGARSRR